jgi:WD40 repeat protein
MTMHDSFETNLEARLRKDADRRVGDHLDEVLALTVATRQHSRWSRRVNPGRLALRRPVLIAATAVIGIATVGGSLLFVGGAPPAPSAVPTPRSSSTSPSAEAFTQTGSMSYDREAPTATLLRDGRVLVVGGFSGPADGTSELFDPSTASFSKSGRLAHPRFAHGAVLLSDGRVLVVGGRGDGMLLEAEVWDPRTGEFASAGNLTAERTNPRLILQADGRVLVAGGSQSAAGDTAELWDPATASFSDFPAPSIFPRDSTVPAVVLGDGRTLVINDSAAQLWDPTSATFSPAGALIQGGRLPDSVSATLLDDGRVLVVGDGPQTTNDASPAVRLGEIWDPLTRSFASAGLTIVPRSRHAAVRLADGSVLILGNSIGMDGGSTAEVFGPAAAPSPSDDGSPPRSPSPLPRNVASAAALTELGSGNWSDGSSTLLPDGRVLILGFDGGAMLARLWDPATARITDAGSVEGNTFESHSATLLDDGRVLIAGGLHGTYGDGPIASALTWDPATSDFTPTGSMITPRYRHLAVGLDRGRVLVLGGAGEKLAVEIYEPDAGDFSALTVRSAMVGYAAATRLADGRVLVLGGGPDGRCTEIWDLSRGAPSVSGPFAGGCEARSATLLRDGQVLVAASPAASGGPSAPDSRTTVMLFDPTRGTYAPAGSMSTTVARSVAVALADGRILFAGGYGADGRTTAVAETWDAASSSFSSSGSLSVARAEPDLTLLGDGRVLVVGGWDVQISPEGGETSSAIASHEVFDPR